MNTQIFMRKIINNLLLFIVLQSICSFSFAQKNGTYDGIYSGIPWLDNKGKIVSAHAGNIIKEKGKFYLFGEAHTDSVNAFVGFNCYSSSDLYNWKFERIALPVQQSGKLGPNRVGERVKVMKNHRTGEFFMYMHVDTLGYKDQFVGYATAKTITGPYTFRGPLLFNGKPIKKWDMGVYQEKDGTGYVLIHGGEIYKLSDNYQSIISKVQSQITSGFESPTMFKKNGIYYFIGSNLTSWERNDNYYYTATAINGPWTFQGLIAPIDKLTWNSQTTYVFPVEGSKDTTYLFMGDRWSFPKQASAATYVWQPLTVSGQQISISQFQEKWQVNPATGITSATAINQKNIDPTDERIKYTGKWQRVKRSEERSESRSDDKNAALSITFTGRQIGIYSHVQPQNGYARIVLTDHNGKNLSSSVVDMYSKTPNSSLVFFTPFLVNGKYKLTVYNTGERPNWSDKRKLQYGSIGNFISVEKLVVRD